MRRARGLLPRVLPAASPPPNSAHEIHARHTQPRASLACSRLFISLARTLRQGSGRTTQEDKSVPPLEPYFTPSGHNTLERSSCPRIEQLYTSERLWLTLSLPRFPSHRPPTPPCRQTASIEQPSCDSHTVATTDTPSSGPGESRHHLAQACGGVLSPGYTTVEANDKQAFPDAGIPQKCAQARTRRRQTSKSIIESGAPSAHCNDCLNAPAAAPPAEITVACLGKRAAGGRV